MVTEPSHLAARAGNDIARRSRERRRLLKGLAVGGGLVGGSLPVPERWTRPILESVVLPAHAQVTGRLSCSAGSLTVDNSDTGGHIAIIYNGASSCSLLALAGDLNQGGDSGNPDEILLLDSDGDPVTDFDLQGPSYGANWGPGPDQDNNPAGNYSFVRQRTAPPNAGVNFRLTFTVSFAGSNLTISNVQVVAI